VSNPSGFGVELMGVPGLISVIVTTYNRSDALAAVMRGLSAQTDPQFEVVIADDGSSPVHRDAALALANSLPFAAIHVWHPDAGFTAAKVRNLGVAASCGSYLIFLDGDCVPEIDFIAQHRRLSETKRFVNGSRILLSERLTGQAVADREQIVGRSRWYWWRHWWAGRASRFMGTWRLPDGAYRVKKQFSWKGIRSCNLAVWRADFIEFMWVGATRMQIWPCGCTMRAFCAKTGFARRRFFTFGIKKQAVTANRSMQLG
jgi:glycosyltransferase involved in cell wall biosynthesis